LNRSHFLKEDFVRQYADPIHFQNYTDSFLADSSRMGYTLAPLPAWLRTEDRASMAFGLESRSPFLDVNVASWMARLPATAKMHAGQSKVVLRRAMTGLLPEAVRDRRDKKGFAAPTDHWFRTELVPQAEAIFDSETFRRRGIFEPRGVKTLFQRHREGKANLRFAIWSWVNLELWFRMFIDPPLLTPVSGEGRTRSESPKIFSPSNAP
jgi:asparagine synthase (glutamine-hydrolysing)